MRHRSRHAVADTRRISLHGVPTDTGAGCAGACMGPAALRIAGLAGRLVDLGYDVLDEGDVVTEGATPVLGRLPAAGTPESRRNAAIALARLTSARAYDTLRSEARPIFLGGDHSLSMGTVAGVARHCRETGRPLFVLWVDAHADFNTPATSPSGNPHGMSLALLCGEPEFAGVVDDDWFAPVDPENVTVFGARSLDREERALLAARGIDVADMRLIDEVGAPALMRAFIDRVERAGGHLHVSLDVDALDPSLAPGVGTTVPGGLTYREAHLAMEMLHDSGLVGSMDIVELNPFLDQGGKSAELLVDLTTSLFGRCIVERHALRQADDARANRPTLVAAA